MKILSLIVFCILFSTPVFSQLTKTLEDCIITIENDTLIVENERFSSLFLWNEGNIIPFRMIDKPSGKMITWTARESTFQKPVNPFQSNLSVSVNAIPQNIYHPEHLLLQIINQHQGVKVRKWIRIYPEISALNMEYALQYEQLFGLESDDSIKTDGTEQTVEKPESFQKSTLFKVGLEMPHWSMKTVEFKDITDVNDNLVFTDRMMPFRSDMNVNGNLLFATHQPDETTVIILKEAPNTTSQVLFPGYDFTIHKDFVSIPFSGFPQKGEPGRWISGYPITVSIAKDYKHSLINLREYLMGSVNYNSEDYDMIMLNTWGDRGRDGRISEEFILAELEKAYQLGITHLQIDDGWQQGLSKNSASQDGQLWYKWTAEDWQPHKDRFPNGLEKVIESARNKNIKLGLWFNPSRHNNYETWDTDAQIIIDIHKQTGIQYFKIDGIEIPTKLAEENLIRFFRKVKDETNNGVFFNLDLTAGTRGGYFSYRWAGNLFLENRYTDWGNYYPYRTLRNLWSLSWYFPPQLLQIEFLNKWRNPDKYPENDPFAPQIYDFSYVFAITMPGQPLAWFEATGLPEQAMETALLIKNYALLQQDIQKGIILPVGDQPDGTSWTGFQSFKKDENEGYFLIFREDNPEKEKSIHIPWLQKGNYRFSVLAGNGENFTQQVDENLNVSFHIPEKNSFQLIKYEPVIR